MLLLSIQYKIPLGDVIYKASFPLLYLEAEDCATGSIKRCWQYNQVREVQKGLARLQSYQILQLTIMKPCDFY